MIGGSFIMIGGSFIQIGGSFIQIGGGFIQIGGSFIQIGGGFIIIGGSFIVLALRILRISIVSIVSIVSIISIVLGVERDESELQDLLLQTVHQFLGVLPGLPLLVHHLHVRRDEMHRRGAHDAGRVALPLPLDHQLHQRVAEVHEVLAGHAALRSHRRLQERPRQALRRGQCELADAQQLREKGVHALQVDAVHHEQPPHAQNAFQHRVQLAGMRGHRAGPVEEEQPLLQLGQERRVEEVRRVPAGMPHQRFEQRKEMQRGAEGGLRVAVEEEQTQRSRGMHRIDGLRAKRGNRQNGRVQEGRGELLERGVERIGSQDPLAESLVVLHQHAQHAQSRVQNRGNRTILGENREKRGNQVTFLQHREQISTVFPSEGISVSPFL